MIPNIKDLKLHGDGPIPFPKKDIRKHYGPIHPGTGTDQSVHGHGSSRVHVGVGSGVRGGKPVDKFLVDAEGKELPLSFEALSDAHIKVNGKISKTKRSREIQSAILDALEEAGLDRTAIDGNLDAIFASALARYEADPSLADADRFYEMWHEVLFDISQRTDTDFSRVITAASVISPSLNAWANIHYANDLATWVSQDIGWEGEDAQAILDALNTSQDAILHPVWLPEQAGVVQGIASIGDPKPPPKEGSHRWTQGQTLLSDYNKLKDQDSFRLSDLSDLSAAYALHAHRARSGGLTVSVPDALAIDHATGNRLPFPQGGFSIKNTQFYADAVGVLRGNVTPSQVLGDVKTRSFHNNILDPTDALDFQDVTVDFHMANAAFMSTGFEESSLISSPQVEGVGVGVRPLAADSIRRFVGRKLGKETLTSGRVQEILWAEWSRGQTEKRLVPQEVEMPGWAESAGARTVTHWRSFDGTYHPLYNVTKRQG